MLEAIVTPSNRNSIPTTKSKGLSPVPAPEPKASDSKVRHDDYNHLSADVPSQIKLRRKS